jgi:hypothetical protein
MMTANRPQTYAGRTQRRLAAYAPPRKSLYTKWACPDLNGGPHAYQAHRAKRVAWRSVTYYPPFRTARRFRCENRNPQKTSSRRTQRVHGKALGVPQIGRSGGAR